MNLLEIDCGNLNQEQLIELCGINNSNIKLLEELLNMEIISRGSIFKIDESNYNKFNEVLNKLINLLEEKETIDSMTIRQVVNCINNDNPTGWKNNIAFYTNAGKPIKFKTYNQYKFSKYMEENDLVFAIGPAGTGKTYLAVLMACKALKQGSIKKIVLTRPAVEAGESLGFLPGDLKEKIDPYLMPLYDSLYEILGEEQVSKLLEKNIIEVIPLAYMRGRTLNDAFVILDEAQNTTSGQMLMFLTRLGYNSKMIVNGDVTQIDLNLAKNKSGLVIATDKLKDTKHIGILEFNQHDVVRNPLVETIIEKFNK